MTIEQFGSSIKQKYPAYQKYSDSEIGQSMLAKYPQYQDQISKPEVKKTAGEKAKNVLTGVSNFVGTTKLAQGLSTVGSSIPNQTLEQNAQDSTSANKIIQAIHAQTDPVKKQRLVDYLRNQYGMSNPGVSAGDINPGFNLSNKEVLGSAAQTALTAASFGQLGSGVKAGGLTEKLLPKVASGLNKGADVLGYTAPTVLGRIGQTGLKYGALGAGFGAAQGLGENKSAGGIAKQALTSAAISGGLGIGAQGLAEFGKALTSTANRESMVNRSLGVPKNVITSGKSPAKEIVAKGQIGSKRGFLNKAEQTIQTSEKAINETLKQNNVLHKTEPLISNIKASLSEVYQGALNNQDVEKIIDNLPIAGLRDNSATTVDRINKLRSILDNKYLGNKKWLASAEAVQPERITALKIAANTLRSFVQTTEPSTIPHFQQMSKALTTKTVLSNELAKSHVLTNIFELMGSGALGAVLGQGSLGKIGQSAATYAAIKALFSTPSVTGISAGLGALGKGAVGPTGQALRGFTRIGTQRGIQATQK